MMKARLQTELLEGFRKLKASLDTQKQKNIMWVEAAIRKVEPDVQRVREFLYQEARDLEALQKQIPKEVVKLKKFLGGQKKDLMKLIQANHAKSKKMAKTSKKGAARTKTVAKKRTKTTS